MACARVLVLVERRSRLCGFFEDVLLFMCRPAQHLRLFRLRNRSLLSYIYNMIASSLASRARFFLFLLRGSTRRKGRQFVTTSYLLLTRVFPGTYTLLKLKRNIFWWVSKQRVACQLLLCSRQYRMIMIQIQIQISYSIPCQRSQRSASESESETK